MKVKINGVEHTMIRHAVKDSRAYAAWAVVDATGTIITTSNLPRGISEGDSFRTGGNMYEIIDKARNE